MIKRQETYGAYKNHKNLIFEKSSLKLYNSDYHASNMQKSSFFLYYIIFIFIWSILRILI